MRKFKVNLPGKTYLAEVERVTDYLYRVKIDENIIEVEVEEEKIRSFKREDTPVVTTGEKVVKTMLPGNITKLLVSEGDRVKAGDTLLILEAMKMENEIVAPTSGTVKKIQVREGQRVETGDILVILE